MKFYKYILITFLLCLSYKFISAQNPGKIIVGVKQTPPFVIKQADGEYGGISILLWENIADDLDLDYEYKEYNLDGLIKALGAGQIDISINPLTVTSKRVEQFDFTQPFFITNLAIAVDRDRENKWLGFIRNFFSLAFFQAVLLLLLVIMAFGVLIWIFEKNKNKEEFGPGMRGVWNGLWWSAVTMTTVGYGDKSPKTAGGRAVAIVWMFTAIIIISGFTASIASSLTVSELEYAIKGPEDLKKVTTLTIEYSTGQGFLKKNDINHRVTGSIETGLQQLVSGKVGAIVYDEPILRYSIKNQELENEVVVLPSKFSTQYYSFSLPKSSHLLSRINPSLLREISREEWQDVLKHYDLGE